MVQGSMSCIKYLLFIFNFVFVICGIALITVGGIVFNKDFSQFLGTKYVTAPTILIVVGVAIFLVAFLGCCGAVKENHCMVMTFGLLLFVIFVVELAGGISAYVYKGQVESFLKENLNTSIAQHHKESMRLWDDIQTEFKCCGVDGAADYTKNEQDIPASCCAKGIPICDATSAFDHGCYPQIRDMLKKNIAIVGGVAIGLAAVELIGCMMAWCLASAIKRDYEGV